MLYVQKSVHRQMCFAMAALLLALLCSCVGCSEQESRHASNTLYGSPIAVSGKYVYLTEYTGGDILRFDTETVEAETFLAARATTLLAANGYLYFRDGGYTLKRVPLNGGEPELLYESQTGIRSPLIMYKGDLYFEQEGELHVDEEDDLYFRDPATFCRLGEDGQAEIIRGGIYATSDPWCAYTGGWLYFCNAEDETTLRMRPDGSEEEKVFDTEVYFMASSDEGVYYRNVAEKESLYYRYIDHDGNVTEIGHWVLHGEGGAMYYPVKEDAEYWLVRSDGGEVTRLSQFWSNQSMNIPLQGVPDFLFVPGWVFSWRVGNGIKLLALNESTLEETEVWKITDKQLS